MKIIKRLYCRGYQNIFKGLVRFVSFSEPQVIANSGALLEVPKLLSQSNNYRFLLVTDKNVFELGLLDQLIAQLDQNNFSYTIFSNVIPNPTIQNVEEGLLLYNKINATAIVACGGGSVIDCAKAIGARATNPTKTIEKMRGVLKVKENLPFFIAIPTTAGTGSEGTISSVITNPKTNDKFALNDPHLTPAYAVLDPMLTVNLPKGLTATTGMDALTHAVEAYIGLSNTKATQKWAKEAVKMIYDNLYECYENPTNIQTRKNMLIASYEAGLAFSRAYVGYVHAIAHAFGGFYNYPHGKANAIILPYVLKAYSSSCTLQLAELCDEVMEFGDIDNALKAKAFIDWIENMNEKMNIKNDLGKYFREEDLELMVERINNEANPLYPVPRLFDKNELKELLLTIIEGSKQSGE